MGARICLCTRPVYVSVLCFVICTPELLVGDEEEESGGNSPTDESREEWWCVCMQGSE